jgi:PAS domain S-box-containing protein
MKLARDGLQRELLSQSSDLAGLTRSLIENRRALQASEHRWWAIYEHAPVGIALISADGGFQAANPAFRTMVGYTGDELMALHLSRVTPVEDRAAALRRLTGLLNGEVVTHHVQRRFQRKDGAMVWAVTSVSLVPGAPGDERLLVLVAADITEQRHAEQSLTRARGELARFARVSTLGELTASIAHEVNQPLAAIVANGHASLRWLEAAPPNETEAKAALGRIVRDANRAGDVITRIRRFVQRHETQHTALDINEAIRDVLELVRSEAQARRIEIVHLDTAPLPEVLADRIQLQQVILNLVMNGLEAMACGGVHGALQIAAHLEAHGVQVDVIDSGSGIAPAIKDRLLDAFQTTKAGGMGMGLAISRSIVESHGGSLWHTPNHGPGVTFSFSLPVASQDSAW